MQSLETADGERARALSGAQTLVRGLEVLTVVARGVGSVQEIAAVLNLSRSTAYRLASTLVDQGFLSSTQRDGFCLGVNLISLGHAASLQISLPRMAHEHLRHLAALTGDSVTLGILDRDSVLCIDKIPGSRRIEVNSRVGERMPLSSTGLGKALLLNLTSTELEKIFYREHAHYPTDRQKWLEDMDVYRSRGCAFDMGENADHVRCVAAPVRNVAGEIIGSIGVASAAQYMDDRRLDELGECIINTANTVSREYGYGAGLP